MSDATDLPAEEQAKELLAAELLIPVSSTTTIDLSDIEEVPLDGALRAIAAALSSPPIQDERLRKAPEEIHSIAIQAELGGHSRLDPSPLFRNISDIASGAMFPPSPAPVSDKPKLTLEERAESVEWGEKVDADGHLVSNKPEGEALLEQLRARVRELECELGINAERNAELAEMAGKPVNALKAITQGKRKFDPTLSSLPADKTGGGE